MTLKNLIPFFMLLCSFSCFAQQEDYTADQIAPALKTRATAVIRKMETTVNMQADDHVIMTVKKVVTVLNKNGDEQAELTLWYSKNLAIKSAKGIILDAFGKPTGKFTLSNFSDHSAVSDISLFEDDRLKHFAPTVLNYPYTVVCEYELRFKQNLMIPVWRAGGIPGVAVASNSFTFTCKPEDKIRIKSTNYKGEPEITESPKSKSMTWTVKNVPAFKPEPFAPDPESYCTTIKIAPEAFNYYGYKGNYQNWKELGMWEYTELIKNRQNLPADAIATVKTLVQGVDNDKDKARKIYEYVQRKTRYISVQIGIGGHMPMQASEVQQLSYGDCKALVNYTQSLLNVINIPSYYCVVNAGNFKKDMDADFASMNQGNHIILCLPLKNDTTWLECTNQAIPFGFLGTFTDDRTVLACTPEGGKILRTPALTTSMNIQKRRAELGLDEEGNVQGSLNTVYSGAQYDNCNQLIGQSLKEQLKLLKGTYDIGNIDFRSCKIIQDKGETPRTTELLEFSIPRYASRTNNHFYLVPNAFNRKRTVPEVSNRTLPLFINRGYVDEDELIYTLPDKVEIEHIPKDTFIKNEFGTYQASIKKEGNKLIYNRKFVLNNGTHPAERYAAFTDFITDVSTADQVKVIFKSII
ncbi:DUF3857 domain-containing protein [Pedobacter africanus]|uniref:DUF3857 domain-containing protein n=1 Tax=Pedobacter africanus TaxID=151894 RepID=A0A1W2DDI1_9SPHI|nr:DUF3857 domain-containing protein [Pedobacter africanus]SMC95531.1 protein of unknown function [Pedobacter africanus]